MYLLRLAVLDERARHATLAQKIHDGLQALLITRGADPRYGRKLPQLLRDHGLESVRADAYFPVASAASRQVLRANINQVRDALIAGGYANRHRNRHLPRANRDRRDRSGHASSDLRRRTTPTRNLTR